MNKKKINFLVSFGISIILLYYLFSKISFSKFFSVLSRARPEFILAGILCYFMVLLMRSLRYHVLLKNTKIKNILLVIFFYNFLNSVLPFKLGEFSFIYLAKKNKLAGFAESFASLIIVRIFDFIILIIFLIYGIFFLGNSSEGFLFISYLAIGILIALLFVLFTLAFHPLRLLKILNIVLQPFSNLGITKVFKKKSEGLLLSFKKLKSSFLLAKVSFVSALIFFFGFFTAYFIFISLGYYIPINSLFVIIPLGSLSGLIPIQGLAGFGTFESLWIVGLVAFGFELESAIILSFSLHIIQLTYTCFFGMIGWIKIRIL